MYNSALAAATDGLGAVHPCHVGDEAGMREGAYLPCLEGDEAGMREAAEAVQPRMQAYVSIHKMYRAECYYYYIYIYLCMGLCMYVCVCILMYVCICM